jgi:hypothetical protein
LQLKKVAKAVAAGAIAAEEFWKSLAEEKVNCFVFERLTRKTKHDPGNFEAIHSAIMRLSMPRRPKFVDFIATSTRGRKPLLWS